MSVDHGCDGSDDMFWHQVAASNDGANNDEYYIGDDQMLHQIFVCQYQNTENA